MSLLIDYLVKLKNLILKNREILLFFTASIVLVMLYPDGRRFPYEWKKGSEWKHPDLLADFSFVRPLSSYEIKERKDSLRASHYYFTLQSSKAEIRYELTDTVPERAYVQKFIEQTFKPFEKKLISDEDIDAADYLRHSCFIIDDSDTFTVDCSGIMLSREIQKYIKKNLDSLYIAQGYTKPDLKINLSPNLLFVKRIEGLVSTTMSNQSSEAIEKGSAIVRNGQLIDNAIHERLLHYKKLYSTGYPHGLNRLYLRVGNWIVTALTLIMLYQFLVFFRPNVFEDSSKLLMILAILIFFFAVVVQVAQKQESWIYFIPLPIVPIVLKAFYDTRLALFCHFLLLLLVGLYVSNVYVFFILHFTSGVFSIITVESIYKRSQLFTSVFKIVAVYFLIYFALELTTGTPNLSSINTYAKLTINAFLILLAFPIIYGIEKIFGMVSDLSLLELSDTNMPLLKELAEKAPGTFQHSLQVSNLAESAADAIGANTLLVRTAALYHDIGKMSHPQFFVENQITGYNPHDELSFEESARVIIDHVKEGVKLARQRKLPESIIDFIRTHHGTTTVQYFYRMYLKNFPENTDSENRFRYDGPTPFSKETAILMLADSVEAACRSLAQHSADKFQMEAQIDAIFESLMHQRQFDNANISLAEIQEVKKTLKKKIINIYHSRIPYPK